jgi:hypothetical protein
MAFNFAPPSSPSIGQVYSPALGYNWIWNGNQWEPFEPPLGLAPVTAGSFNAGSATVVGTNPINITAVTPFRVSYSVGSPNAGSVAYGNGSSIAFSAVGTAGRALISDGTNTPTWVPYAGSPGRVFFTANLK